MPKGYLGLPSMFAHAPKPIDGKIPGSIGYWIQKSALCAHILHEFVVLLEAKPSAKPQTSAMYGRIMHECGIQYLTCCTLETTF